MNEHRDSMKRNGPSTSSSHAPYQAHRIRTMEMPLFPLKNVVLFPGMVLPLHIFEPRYKEMINRCIEERIPFGVTLIAEGAEVGGSARPHAVGTAARIVRVERLDDGRMNITCIGTQRFRILEIHQTQSYLTASVVQFPVVNGATRRATELAERLRPMIIEYVQLLSKASNTKLKLDRLPEDPLTLAFLIAISLQIGPHDKQQLLEAAGVPDILGLETKYLSREAQLLQYMLDTRDEVQSMNGGPTGYVFPN